MKGLRKILNVKNPYWSRVSNKQVLERVNVRPSGELENKELKRLSTRLIERQTVLYAHIIRADEADPMKHILITDQGERLKADFRRVGRPRAELVRCSQRTYHNTTEKGRHHKLPSG